MFTFWDEYLVFDTETVRFLEPIKGILKTLHFPLMFLT